MEGLYRCEFTSLRGDFWGHKHLMLGNPLYNAVMRVWKIHEEISTKNLPECGEKEAEIDPRWN